MEITFTTPALLFPAISLLLIAYTNRFLAIANLVRKLHDDYKRGEANKHVIQQIQNLRRRISLIRWMQGLGVFSFLGSVICMYCIYLNLQETARYVFAISLITLVVSLVLSLVEIVQSGRALEMEISDIESDKSGFFKDLWSGKKNE